MFTDHLAPTATTLIRMDHTHTLLTFRRYHDDTPMHLKRGLVDTVCLALEVHAQLEEEIFYPALREVMPSDPAMDKSVPEHAEMRRLIGELRALGPDDTRRDELFLTLMRDVLHHVADEETVLLPAAERLLADQLRPLGGRMLKRRAELVLPRTGELVANLARATPPSKWLWLAGATALAGVAIASAANGRAHRPEHRLPRV